MKNGDMPASPCIKGGGKDSEGVYQQGVNFLGFTKREVFAMAAMKGLLSNPNVTGPSGTSWTAQNCLNQADDLLEALSQPIDQPEEA